MKRKQPMPGYYGKNIAQNAQRRFLQRKKRERELLAQERRDEEKLREMEQRTATFERGEADHL